MRVAPSAILAAAALSVLAPGASAAPADHAIAQAAARGELHVWVTDLPRNLRARVSVIGAGATRRVTGDVKAFSLTPGTYRVVARPVAAGRRTYHPRQARTRVRVRADGTAVAAIDYGTVVPRSTRPFTRAMARRLVRATSRALVFAGTAPIGLRRGQVVIGGPVRGLPEGVIRRVVAVGARDGRTVVRTSPARLFDALPSGDLAFTARVGRGMRGTRTIAGTEKRLGHVRIPFSRTLFERGLRRGGCEVDADTTLSGELEIEPTIRISSKWRLFPFPKVKRASFSATLSERFRLVLAAAMRGSCRASFDTPDIRIGAFTVPAGPIAVPVTVEADLEVAMEAQGEVNADAELRQELELTGGLAYSGGDLEPINRFKLGYTFDRPRIEMLQGGASVRLGPRLKLEVASVAGPYLNVSGTADLEVRPTSDPSWSLYGGLSVRGGLSLFGLRKDLELYSKRLRDPIATARGGGFVETPPELAAPPPATRGPGRIFPRPDLTEAPVDALPPGTPLTVVCAIAGPPVTSSDASSGTWYGLADGTFANGGDVAAAPPGGLPGCVVPPPRREEPRPAAAPRPRPRPQPQPRPEPAPTVADRDRDGIADASDACPDAGGVAPRGCPRVRGLAVGPDGYWLAAEDGGVFSFGVPFHGSAGGQPLNGPVVGIASNPATRDGYWLAAADGGVFGFNTGFHGSAAGTPLNRPVVGIAARPQGDGYWLAASDGGVFAFGAAPFLGSLAGTSLNAPVVGIAATPSGAGFWLVAADGGVFAFGDAPYLGGLVGTPLNGPIVGIAPTPSGQGYWLVGADGGVFAKGDAGFFGSRAGLQSNQPMVGIAATPSGAGYWLVGGDGGVFSFGDAAFRGSTA